MSERNPYTPPNAAVDDEPTARGVDTLVPDGRRRPASHGWKWIAAGWALFKQRPGIWILAVVLGYGSLMALSLVPLVNLVAAVVWPVLTAGFVAMAHAGFRREPFGFGQLLAGFKRQTGPLVLIGVIYLALWALCIGVFMLIGGSIWFGVATGSAEPHAVAGLGMMVLLYVLIMIVIGFAIVFAPALVFLNEVPPLSAIRMSILGSAKNFLPGLVSSIVFIPIFIVSMLPLGLGLLITVPLMFIIFYTAYRDIFLVPAGE
jgi:hypothetical protein